MSLILKAIAKDGRLSFLNQIDLGKFCIEYDNKELLIEIKEYNKSGAKAKLFAYYFAVVLKTATAAYRSTGEMIDDVESDYRLRAEFSKTFIKDKSGEYIAVLKDKRDMTKDELLQYVQDCIFFIESNFGWQVPDSASYKMLKKTGKNYQPVKPENK